MDDVITLESRFSAQNYLPIPVVLTRGEGVYLWDIDNKRYMDMMSAYSAVSLGHCHPEIIEVLTSQAHQLGIVSRAFHHDLMGKYLKTACEMTGMDMAMPLNTGGEAVDTALKAARKWAYDVKGVANDKAEIIACRGNFHGRTIAIVGLSSEEQYRQGFGPFPEGLKVIPYGDAMALEKAITANTAGFLVEPIQGEGGIVIPPVDYLSQCAEICKQNNVLFMCDEIQTGLSRTGKFLACQHEAVVPDILMLGKALGGGVLPVSLLLGSREVMEVFYPGDHGSTFGGYSIACAVGKKSLELLYDQNLIETCARLGEYFISQLQAIDSPLIKEVRGRGLFVGLEIKGLPARDICMRLLDEGILSKETHNTVVRLAPPLIITKEEIDEAVQKIERVLT